MRIARAVLLTVLLLSIAAGMQAQNAQPAIIDFTADLPAISVSAAEAGATNVTLAWQAVNLSEGQRLVVEQHILGAWQPLVPAEETLQPIGSLLLPVQHPLDFGPPTYRLSLLDAGGALLDQRYLMIPYQDPGGTAPTIELFTSSTAAVLGESLADGSARVNVSWKVTNRVPGSNLRFVQQMENGTTVPVELPREHLWVSSSGSGVVSPVPPLSGSVIRVLLQVVDLVSDEVYAQADVEVAVGGAVANTVAENSESAPVPTVTVAPANCSISELDVPLRGAPGDGCDIYLDSATGQTARVAAFSLVPAENDVTVNWQVEGAQFALLEVYDPDQLAQAGLPEAPEIVRDGLPTTGSTTIELPDSLKDGARFILWATNLSTEARSPSLLYDRLAYRIIDMQGNEINAAAEITAFIALPPVVTPGDEVSLSWSLHGADSALIELYDLGSGALVGEFEDLPIVGSAHIVIPDSFEQGARFILWATNRTADGDYVRLIQQTVEVPAG